MKERRKRNRAATDFKVDYSSDGANWSESRSKNISPSGLFMTGGEHLEPGRTIMVRFQLPGVASLESFNLKAEIVHAAETGPGGAGGVGLRFFNLEDERRTELESYIGLNTGFKNMHNKKTGANPLLRWLYFVFLSSLAVCAGYGLLQLYYLLVR